ncbi:MAG: TadE/TadG family type IV pilus assembly protein [Pseudomonadota bacterium]
MTKLRRHCGVFLRDRKGATAVEYAIVGPLFFMILFVTAEYSLYLYKRNYLKHSMYTVSRILQTGEIQNHANPQVEFNRQVCAVAKSSFDCRNVFVDVRSFDDLSAVTFPTVQLDANLVPTNFKFSPGGPAKVTAMRFAAHFDFVTPFMDDFFGLNGEPLFVVGHSVAKNEPYVCTKSAC